MEQVGIVPASFESFSVDAAFGGFMLLEQVEGDAVEYGKVVCGMARAFVVEVFAEAHIEYPVQFVFDAPVLANGAVQPRRIGLQTGNIVACLTLGLARGLVVPLSLDA